MLERTLWVGLGGFIGAAGRYMVSGWVQRVTGGHFPYGTMVVNVGGSVLLGFLAVGMLDRIGTPLPVRLLILTGILGAFTTFSTFSYESVLLLQDGSYGAFLGNVAGNLIFCLTAAATGIVAARGLF